MAATRFRSLLDHIEQLSSGASERQGTDRQLLDDFSTRHDETAFAELVARHGALVLRVCRRVLHHEQDAEDAFQATFLVLARCSGSIRKREALADWLHGVAYRTAMKAKRGAARRRNHEAQLRDQTRPRAASPTWDDVQTVLDEEIQRLPASFRSAFVLCVLEGKTVPAAAAELGWKEGTMSSRLTRARQRLQQQLSRRGIMLAALLAALCVAEGVAKAVPAALGQTVIRNGLLVAAGGSAAGVIPPHVTALAAGVTRAMFLQKAKIAVVVLLTLSLFVAGAGVLTHQMLKAEEIPAVAQPAVKSPAEPAKPAEDLIEETKTVEVSGFVLTPDGKPCAGAKLFIPRPKKPVVSQVDLAVEQVGTSGTDGRFHVMFKVPAKRLFCGLIAHADGFGVNWVEVRTDQPAGDVTVKLAKDQPITGRVLDTEGKPVAGVMVRIADIQEPDNKKLDDYLTQWKKNWMDAYYTPKKYLNVPSAIIAPATTDSKGRFKLTGAGAERIVKVMIQGPGVVPAMPHVLTRSGFEPKSYNDATLAQIPDYERQGRDMPILSGPDATIVVQGDKVIEGVVRDRESGKPLSGVRVSPSSWTDFNLGKQVAVTDVNGKYRLNGLPPQETYEVYAEPPDDNSYLRQHLSSKTAPGIAPVRIDFELVCGVVVSGQVIDKQTGKGVEARVFVVPLPENKHYRQPAFAHTDFSARNTDRQGGFRLVTIPGKSLLFVEVPGQVKIDDGEPWYLAVERREHEEELCPYAMGVPDPKYKDLFQYDAAWGFWRLTSAFDPLGQTVLRFRAVKVLDLKEDGGAVKVELPLERGRTAKVLVQDADGKPLTRVRAGGVTADLHVWHRLKDESAVTVYGLNPTQPRRLTFLHLEKNLGATATVRGDEKEAVVVKLVPLGAATGRFVDAEGRPLAGVEVSVVFREPPPGLIYTPLATKTNQEGRFTLPSILPGKPFRLGMVRNFMGYASEPRIGFQDVASGKTLDLGERKLKPVN